MVSDGSGPTGAIFPGVPCNGKWFIFLSFNPGAFVREDGKTILRDNWQEYANGLWRYGDRAVACPCKKRQLTES
jgi:hypothetical protein